ncbi:MAG TPA: hypothetical protein ENL20_03440 [Candidatus Cloacimonetes bacterium]|nr:hypothetical protein [Candidatus Cloacimonadota bacterium]
MKKIKLSMSSLFQCSRVGTHFSNALRKIIFRYTKTISTQERPSHHSNTGALELVFSKLFLVALSLFILLSFACSLNFIKKRLAPPHQVKGGVLFQYEAPSARLVTLAGDFPDNLWGGTASSNASYDSTVDPMFDDGTHGDKVAGDGIWSLIKPLEPGRYQYKFVVDRNTWVTDPNGLEFVDDGYGGNNSILTVK